MSAALDLFTVVGRRRRRVLLPRRDRRPPALPRRLHPPACAQQGRQPRPRPRGARPPAAGERAARRPQALRDLAARPARGSGRVPADRARGAARRTARMIDALNAGIALLVLGLAIWTIVARDTFAAIVGYVAYGLLLTLAWVALRGVDVALTEAAIGGGLTGRAADRARRRSCAGPRRRRTPSGPGCRRGSPRRSWPAAWQRRSRSSCWRRPGPRRRSCPRSPPTSPRPAWAIRLPRCCSPSGRSTRCWRRSCCCSR